MTAVVYPIFKPQGYPEVNLTGYLGGEKKGLLSNPEFKKLIKKKYNLTMDYKVVGSLEMVNSDNSEQDYLFPSSQLALELFKNQGKQGKQDEIIFNTPIVLYSRKKVVDALVNEGIVNKKDNVYYVDMIELANLMREEKSWADVGLSELNGKILVSTTNPNESNSGNMFLGLLANALNQNKMIHRGNIDDIKPTLQKIYRAMGYMQRSSSDMFNQFMRMGYGAYPLIAGYENQLLEFSKNQPKVYEQVKDDVMILYPSPTVWSSHVYISLTDESKIAIEALSDPQVQELAWKEHGFRTIVSGTADPKEFPVSGLAKDITNTMNVPNIEEMEVLMESVR